MKNALLSIWLDPQMQAQARNNPAKLCLTNAGSIYGFFPQVQLLPLIPGTARGSPQLTGGTDYKSKSVQSQATQAYRQPGSAAGIFACCCD